MRYKFKKGFSLLLIFIIVALIMIGLGASLVFAILNDRRNFSKETLCKLRPDSKECEVKTSYP